ncbi:unnamed protein product [Amoebophrya sp. A120]|nr:unnamed protein product [Amoebophrya sp. A120]|eukprot:GSA120T00003759001.1
MAPPLSAGPEATSLEDEAHYRSLERGYAAAPISGLINLHRMAIGKGKTVLRMPTTNRQDLCHTGKQLHGSVYFKLLDDAAYFAAQSYEREVFLLTTSFSLYLMRPVRPEDKGMQLEARGLVINATTNLITAEATLWSCAVQDQEPQGSAAERGEKKAQEVIVGKGIGTFQRSKIPLKGLPGFSGEDYGGNRFEKMRGYTTESATTFHESHRDTGIERTGIVRFADSKL